jgi:hypothetical protein
VLVSRCTREHNVCLYVCMYVTGRDGRPRDDRARIYLQSLIMRAWAGLAPLAAAAETGSQGASTTSPGRASPPVSISSTGTRGTGDGCAAGTRALPAVVVYSILDKSSRSEPNIMGGWVGVAFSLRGLSLHSRDFFINSACWGAALRAYLPPSRLTTYRYGTIHGGAWGWWWVHKKEARPPVHAIGRLRRGAFADGHGASRASATAMRLRPKKASMPGSGFGWAGQPPPSATTHLTVQGVFYELYRRLSWIGCLACPERS